MDNSHHNAIFSRDQEIADSPSGQNLNEKDWQESLRISAPAGLPTPEQLANAASMGPANPDKTAANPFNEVTADTTNLGVTTPNTVSSNTANANAANLDVANRNTPSNPAEIGNFPNQPVGENQIPFGQISSLDQGHTDFVTQPTSYNPTNIRTTGDHLDKASIKEIDNALDELNQTGNLGNFYDEIRSMTEANLDNSFNRKLGEDHLGGSQ